MLTKRTEGRAEIGSYGALWEVLPTIEYLLGTLERKAVEYGAEIGSWKQLTAKTAPQIFKQMDVTHADHKHILQSIKHGWSKLESYYNKLDESPVYAASIFLHPEHKSRFLKPSATGSWRSEPHRRVGGYGSGDTARRCGLDNGFMRLCLSHPHPLAIALRKSWLSISGWVASHALPVAACANK